MLIISNRTFTKWPLGRRSAWYRTLVAGRVYPVPGRVRPQTVQAWHRVNGAVEWLNPVARLLGQPDHVVWKAASFRRVSGGGVDGRAGGEVAEELGEVEGAAIDGLDGGLHVLLELLLVDSIRLEQLGEGLLIGLG